MTADHARNARATLGLTQAQMAKAVGLADGRSWRRYELGQREMPGTVEVMTQTLLRLRMCRAELESISTQVHHLVDGVDWAGPVTKALPGRIRAVTKNLTGDDR